MLNFRYTIAVVLFLLFVLFVPGLILAEEFPVTIVDDLDKEIRIDKKPERIISLAPSMTELLFALGLEDEVVGVTTLADYPAEAVLKEKIGTIVDPSVEKIISLKPDLVLAVAINKEETITQLRRLGIKVAGFDPHNIKESIELIKKVGLLTGQQETARVITTELTDSLTQIEQLVVKELQDRQGPKVFYEIWSNPLYTAGSDTFIDDIINIAGGINIGSKADGAWPQYSLEVLILEDPDVYIASPHSSAHKVTVEKIKNRDNYQGIKAVRNGRVYIVDQDIVSRPSPRIIDAIMEFLRAILPEVAEKVEPGK